VTTNVSHLTSSPRATTSRTLGAILLCLTLECSQPVQGQVNTSAMGFDGPRLPIIGNATVPHHIPNVRAANVVRTQTGAYRLVATSADGMLYGLTVGDNATEGVKWEMHCSDGTKWGLGYIDKISLSPLGSKLLLDENEFGVTILMMDPVPSVIRVPEPRHFLLTSEKPPSEIEIPDEPPPHESWDLFIVDQLHAQSYVWNVDETNVHVGYDDGHVVNYSADQTSPDQAIVSPEWKWTPRSFQIAGMKEQGWPVGARMYDSTALEIYLAPSRKPVNVRLAGLSTDVVSFMQNEDLIGKDLKSEARRWKFPKVRDSLWSEGNLFVMPIMRGKGKLQRISNDSGKVLQTWYCEDFDRASLRSVTRLSFDDPAVYSVVMSYPPIKLMGIGATKVYRLDQYGVTEIIDATLSGLLLNSVAFHVFMDREQCLRYCGISKTHIWTRSLCVQFGQHFPEVEK
jgi:hypothetical protein